jgi:multiple sugar transport system permease protein
VSSADKAMEHQAARHLLGQKKKQAIQGWVFILPLLVYFAIFQLLPFILSFLISFTNWDGSSTTYKWVGLRNYQQIFTNSVLYPTFWSSLGTTFLYMLFTVPLSIISAVIVAAMLNSGIKGERFYKTAFYIPCVTASAAMSAMWLFLLDPTFGLVGGLNSLFHTSWDPLHQTGSALFTLAVMSIWGGLGYNVLIVESAMKNIDHQLYDACEIDGGGTWTKFIHVTIPSIMPTLYFLIITSVIGSLQAFDAMYLMTGGGPEGSTTTYMLVVYRTMFTSQKAGVASAMSYFLFFIIMIITFIQFKVVPQGYQSENNEKMAAKEARREARRKIRRERAEARHLAEAQNA